jgi:hypothetical protein
VTETAFYAKEAYFGLEVVYYWEALSHFSSDSAIRFLLSIADKGNILISTDIGGNDF